MFGRAHSKPLVVFGLGIKGLPTLIWFANSVWFAAKLEF